MPGNLPITHCAPVSCPRLPVSYSCTLSHTKWMKPLLFPAQTPASSLWSPCWDEQGRSPGKLLPVHLPPLSEGGLEPLQTVEPALTGNRRVRSPPSTAAITNVAYSLLPQKQTKPGGGGGLRRGSQKRYPNSKVGVCVGSQARLGTSDPAFLPAFFRWRSRPAPVRPRLAPVAAKAL